MAGHCLANGSALANMGTIKNAGINGRAVFREPKIYTTQVNRDSKQTS